MELFKRDLITGNIEAEGTHTVQNTIYTLDVYMYNIKKSNYCLIKTFYTIYRRNT